MWMAVLISYILASLFLFVISQISPYDRQPEFTISNCFWFMLGGILQRSTQSPQPKVRHGFFSLLADIHGCEWIILLRSRLRQATNMFDCCKNGIEKHLCICFQVAFDGPFHNPDKWPAGFIFIENCLNWKWKFADLFHGTCICL